MKCCLSSWFVFCVVLASCTNNDVIVDVNQEERDIVNVEASMKIYSNLMDSFREEKTRGVTGDDYPDYYGGGYIDDDGFLVIWVKKGFAVPMSLSENASVIVKRGLYSYNELIRIMDTIDEFMGQSLQTPVSHNVSMWALDDKNNRIEVYLKDCTSTAIEEFRKAVVDSPAIVFMADERVPEPWNRVEIFYESVPITRATINVCAGTKIYAAAEGSTMASPGSFGYKAKRNGIEGFVTAGHVAAVNDLISKPVESGSTSVYLIGKCNASEHKNNGTLDAAFCVLTSSSFALTNQIGNTGKTYSSTLYRNYTVGTPVYLCGGITSSAGKITQMKVSTKDNATGVVIKDMVQADYACVTGDSGGLVYSSIGNVNYVLGVHHSSTHSGTTYVATFCPADRIQDEMGISPSI